MSGSSGLLGGFTVVLHRVHGPDGALVFVLLIQGLGVPHPERVGVAAVAALGEDIRHAQLDVEKT